MKLLKYNIKLQKINNVKLFKNDTKLLKNNIKLLKIFFLASHRYFDATFIVGFRTWSLVRGPFIINIKSWQINELR